jgi:hypothetical protein
VLVWGARDRRFKSSHPDKEMKKILIGVVILLGLAIVTNPNERKHKEAVKREFDAKMERELGTFGEFLSADFKLKGRAINTFITRENHYIYSKTIFKIAGKEKLIGYGFFGFVVINTNALKN